MTEVQEPVDPLLKNLIASLPSHYAVEEFTPMPIGPDCRKVMLHSALLISTDYIQSQFSSAFLDNIC